MSTARRRVSPAEHDVLSVARAVVGAAPAASVRSLLRREVGALESWSPGALAALRRMLAVGCTTSLLRRGGWRSETSLDGRRGALWHRHDPPGWRFGPVTIDVLLALTGAPVAREPAPLGDGDELFLYLACDLLVRAHHDPAILGRWVRASRLARLAFPDAVAQEGELAPLTLPPAVLLEGLGPDLARHLVRLERGFSSLASVPDLTALGERHEADLGTLWEQSLKQGRPDLCTFAVDALPALLAAPRARAVSLARGRLDARQRALRASGATFAVVGRMGTEHARWRRAGFLDDDYDTSQRMLLRWEHVGPGAFEAAAVRLRELSSLEAALAP